MVFNPIPEFFGNSLTQLNQKTTNIYDQETVTRMITEAVKAEREACAKVCEDREEAWRKAGFLGNHHEFREMAFAIRARGEA